jgi:hypothetical protein
VAEIASDSRDVVRFDYFVGEFTWGKTFPLGSFNKWAMIISSVGLHDGIYIW